MKKNLSKDFTVHAGIAHALGHDIKQPLGLIRAYSYYIQKMLPKGEEKLGSYTEKINFQVDVIAAMLNNVVESIKLSNDQVVYKNEEIHLTELLQSIVTELQAMYPEILFQLELEPSSSKIMGDELYLRLAFRNIIDNAARFSNKSEPVKVKAMMNKNTYSISCSNAGSIIPSDEEQLITQPYYKAKNATESSTKGLGVGLYIANEIIQHHNGSLNVKSTSSHTAVTVMLPLE